MFLKYVGALKISPHLLSVSAFRRRLQAQKQSQSTRNLFMVDSGTRKKITINIPHIRRDIREKKIWHWKLLQNNLMSGDLTTVELMPFQVRGHGLGCSPGYLLLLDPQSEDSLFYGKDVFFMHYSWTLAKTIASKSCCPQTLWQFLLCFPVLKMCQGTSIAFPDNQV